MTAHTRVPLGEICKINPRAQRHGFASDTLVSFVPMAAVDERLGAIAIREDRSIADVSKGYTPFQDGDVLFAKITPCMENGKAAIARDLTNGMGSGSTEFYVLRPDGKVLGEYIYHFVRQPQFRETAKRNFTGTAGQQRVPKSFMEDVLIPLPPLDDQQRIVGILNRAAQIERMRARARELMGEFIRALFVRMFGRENPDARHWPIYRVDQLLKDGRRSIRTGPFGSQLKHSEFTDEGVPVLGIDNAVANRFVWAKPRYLAPAKYEPFVRYRVFPGDVIVTIMGTTGRVCVAPEDLPECMSTKHLCVLTLDRSRVEPYFIWGALLFDDNVRVQTRLHAQGQIMEGWNLSIVKRLQIRVPPLSRQRAFCELAAQTLAMEETASNSADAASELPSSLMNRLLKGDK